MNSYNTGDLKVHLETGNGSAGTEVTSVTGAFSLAQWHLLSASVDRTAGTARLYMDGADITASGSIRTDFSNQSDVNAARMTNSGFYLKGTIDEARILSATASSNWVWASWMTVASNATFASYSTVTQQTPALKICASGSNLILNWPASGVGLSIYTTTNLTPPVLWTSATNQPFLTNSQWQITLPPGSDATRFYRLQSS